MSLVFLFYLLPILACLVLGIPIWRLHGLAALAGMNPYVLLVHGMSRPLVLRGGMTVGLLPTISCCVLLLGGTAVLLRSAMRLVGSVALRRAMGEPTLLDCLRCRELEVETTDGVSEGRRRDMGRDWSAGQSLVFSMVPFGQAFVMVLTTLDGYISTAWWFGRRMDASGIAMLMLISLVGYLLVSLAFTWRAMRAFRRRIF